MTKQVTKDVFDLDSFDDVRLVKEFEFEPAADVNEALTRLQNDQKRLLEIVNKGLLAEAEKAIRQETDGWHTFDDEDKINGAFNGIIADPKKVNAIVLTMAKTVFGFNKDQNKEQKRASKEQAKDFVRKNDAIREGLKKSAAFTENDDDDE